MAASDRAVCRNLLTAAGFALIPERGAYRAPETTRLGLLEELRLEHPHEEVRLHEQALAYWLTRTANSARSPHLTLAT